MTTEEEYVDWKEVEKYAKTDYSKPKYKGIMDILNQPVIIKSFEFMQDTGKYGTKDMVIIHSDLGDIRTASTVIIKQLHALETKLNGRALRTMVKAVKSGNHTYYTLEQA